MPELYSVNIDCAYIAHCGYARLCPVVHAFIVVRGKDCSATSTVRAALFSHLSDKIILRRCALRTIVGMIFLPIVVILNALLGVLRQCVEASLCRAAVIPARCSGNQLFNEDC